MNSNSKYIWSIIIVLILVGAYFSMAAYRDWRFSRGFYSTPECDQSGTTTPCGFPLSQEPREEIPTLSIRTKHLTTTDETHYVTLCKNTYKAKQVALDGVGVVQRIARLATETPTAENAKGHTEMNKILCEEKGFINFGNPGTLSLEISAQQTSGTEVSESQYLFEMNGVTFVVDTVLGKIYLFGGEYGPNELVGNLKW